MGVPRILDRFRRLPKLGLFIFADGILGTLGKRIDLHPFLDEVDDIRD
jgi:hypothetical protein